MDRGDGGGVATARSGGWREAFLGRHRREPADDPDNDLLGEPRARSVSSRRAACGTAGSSRAREGSRGRLREGSRPPPDAALLTAAAEAADGTGFDQKAVLEQDRALIEQLTQRQVRRERSAVRKPPPPPKVTPYRGNSSASTPKSEPSCDLLGPGTPTGSPGPTDPEVPMRPPAAAESPAAAVQHGTPGILGAAAVNITEAASAALPVAEPPGPGAAEGRRPDSRRASPGPTIAGPMERTLTPRGDAALAQFQPAAPAAALGAPVEPVVPKLGGLFTASDIDGLMDKLGTKDSLIKACGPRAEEVLADALRPNPAVARDQCVQNFGDISKEFYRDNHMEAPARLEAAAQQPVLPPEAEEGDFKVPERKALKQQINAIDSWLEEDISARELLQAEKNGKQPSGQRLAPRQPPPASVADPTAAGLQESAAMGAQPQSGGTEADVFHKLEEFKRKKALGERVSPVVLKEVASQAKPLFPTMAVDQLVRALRLFTSARHEDHDLYLRILGEIPVQVRGMTPESLTTCVRVLWRLRLHEETYLELFSMEAMNMIRAKRKPVGRAPRRPPAPSRNVDTAATAAAGGNVPVPPAPPPPEAPSPFSPTQLMQLGNALSQLGAKHPPRFMEVFQEQLALAIPRLTQEECELMSPTFAMSQLLHDPLRRAFLERCAQVDAGSRLPDPAALGGAAPDIGQYQREAAARRRRQKHFRNVYIIEASVRKETFSFFTSLSADVRSYLDRLHADGAALEHEGPGALACQIATVLDQLGVSCDMKRTAGPLSLHIVAKATNPRAEVSEIIYECSEAGAFYAKRQDDKGNPPPHTASAKLRHRLLQRLGIQLTHISIWDWQQMSEAQRINYMVKVQSLQ